MNMKFALAAGVCAAALAGFSDVTSANVVGYMNTETPSGGSKMIAPMFLSVSSPNGTFKLSDLRGADYDPDGTAGDLTLIVLSPGGVAEKFTAEDGVPEDLIGQVKMFSWYDIPDDTDAGWYDLNGETPWPADKISFKAGQSFWTSGYGVKLVTAGQVGVSLVTITTPNGGSVGCGNPFAMPVKLSDMYASDYDPDGTAGDLTMIVLSPGGVADKFTEADNVPAELIGQVKMFSWYDIPDDTDAGWYDLNGETPWPADKISFPAGQGFWTSGYGVKLNIPAPKID